MKSRRPLAALAALLAPGLLALPATGQRDFVLPPQYRHAEAPNQVFWALSPFDCRRQLILGDAYLASLSSGALAGIEVRRNGDDADLAAGRVHVVLELSHAAMMPAVASRQFAQNRGPDAVRLFDGWVALPSSPPPRTAPAAWRAGDSVSLMFSQPFTYAAGPLCLETETQADPAQPAWWPVDGVVEPVGGVATSFGASCIAGFGATPAGAEVASLTPGGDAALYLSGPYRPVGAALLVGGSDRQWGAVSLPLSLAGIGAPGCLLSVSADATVPAVLRPMTGGRGLATVAVPLSWTGSLGATFFTQWLVLDPVANPLGLQTSNAVAASVSASPPRHSVAWIEAGDLTATSGRVVSGRLPVLRFLRR